MSSPAIFERIESGLSRCRIARRHRTITERWGRQHQALDGISIDAIVECCAQGTTAQNPLIDALLDLHQNGDPDAGTVLLAVFVPMVRAIARNDRDRDANDLMAAVAHTIATIDPHTDPVDSCGEPKAFIGYLGQRLRASHDSLDPAQRRFRRSIRGRLVALKNDAAAQHLSTRSVEDQAIAGVELSQIAHAINSGDIDTRKWNYIVDYRINPAPGQVLHDSERAAAYRAARNLSDLISHAA